MIDYRQNFFSLSNFLILAFDKKSIINNNKNIAVSGHDSIIGDNFDKRLINLCRAHDEICDIAKQINRMFSFQMLITMAYGFLNVTAQLYFLYCGLIEKVRHVENSTQTCFINMINLNEFLHRVQFQYSSEVRKAS